MATKYVGTYTTRFYTSSSGSKHMGELLWGDRVTTLTSSGTRLKVKARGRTGYVKRTDLDGTALLEVYFIDVGQGDGVLICTPDRRHVLIDGGYNRSKQPTRKNAADFVDWKFAKDYDRSRIEIDAMIASHNDADHYGGLWDLVNPDETDELDLKNVRVEAFYHAGQSWWRTPTDSRTLGRFVDTIEGSMFIDLIEDRASVLNGLESNANPQLQGQWADFLRCVTTTRKISSDGFTKIKRLSDLDGFVPGFDGSGGGASLKVLAPVEFDVGGKPAIRRHGGTDSWNTNGNSVLLRVDYGRARILLTGDLNSRSQANLIKDYAGRRVEFACDVAKACHHGSEDVSYEFLRDMYPAVTVISSGDNEGHDHPRPSIVAASAATGYVSIENDRLETPLIYSTELARSVSFGKPTELDVPHPSGTGKHSISGAGLAKSWVEYEEVKAGDLSPRTRSRTMDRTLVVAGLIYGLVNVRTDGDRILCATMNEKNGTWQYKVIQSRF